MEVLQFLIQSSLRSFCRLVFGPPKWTLFIVSNLAEFVGHWWELGKIKQSDRNAANRGKKLRHEIYHPLKGFRERMLRFKSPLDGTESKVSMNMKFVVRIS